MVEISLVLLLLRFGLVGCVNLICGKVVLSLVEPVRSIFGLFIYFFCPSYV